MGLEAGHTAQELNEKMFFGKMRISKNFFTLMILPVVFLRNSSSTPANSCTIFFVDRYDGSEISGRFGKGKLGAAAG